MLIKFYIYYKNRRGRGFSKGMAAMAPPCPLIPPPLFTLQPKRRRPKFNFIQKEKL
jgi:hypothetical protein